MSDVTELSRLADLHARGVLTDDEFSRAKARLLNGPSASASGMHPAVQAVNGLRRSRDDRWIGGVCGGLAEATGLVPWAWRLIFVLMFLFAGSGLLMYVILWLLVPAQPMALPPRVGSAGLGG